MKSPSTRRSWFQFRLASLLLLITIVAVGLAFWMNHRLWTIEHQTALKGNWDSTYIGGDPDIANEYTIQMVDGFFIMSGTQKDSAVKFRYTVSPDKNPAWIDLQQEPGQPSVGMSKGIYWRTGDSLRICWGNGETRPTRLLNDRVGVLMDFKRRADPAP
jgi:uncharacterized protein (TIGR03067 family)